VAAKNGDKKNPAIARALAEIDHAREEVAGHVGALREEISRAVEWREWYRRRPGLCLATAFALGYLIGRRS
jgi:hypothetical protein